MAAPTKAKKGKKGRKANKIGRSARQPGTMNGARVWDSILNCWLSEKVSHAAAVRKAA